MEKGKIQLKPRLFILLIVFLIVFIGSTFYFFQNANGQEIKESNLIYGSNPAQILDVYTPKVQNGEKLPVIIYAHGGGWSGGDKTNVAAKPDFFTKKGYAFVSINYRLSPNATYEEMANDVSKAIKWVYENANKYHFDRTKINLMGHSAGGHLIMLIVTNPTYLNNVGLSSKTIHSIVNIEGPLDLTNFIKRFGKYKKVFGNHQKVWQEASPITYAATKNLPPILLIAHGRISVEPFMSITKKVGNIVKYFEAKTNSHSQLTQFLGTSRNEEAANMTNAVTEFLEKY
ncbi:para-nitrobenzyl esterase [Bacillus sp. MUM 116]|uniref:alpha/beta hydrolase n=1 Tax=Bacillus sp. MUM 116 TaxID=1678002 RepID=UPI0008F57B19|nr:alpha/beta hydrolase [Bacillus sp. MUM 116]OIK12665.1 para-nitrobenzyl esterase [Bacillus sp. MUM 116]